MENDKEYIWLSLSIKTDMTEPIYFRYLYKIFSTILKMFSTNS